MSQARRQGWKERSSITQLELVGAGVYTRLVQERVSVWVDVRSNADHGNFDEYTEADVRDMLRDVPEFLSTHLS